MQAVIDHTKQKSKSHYKQNTVWHRHERTNSWFSR